jgi:hypothetical protein
MTNKKYKLLAAYVMQTVAESKRTVQEEITQF